MPNFKMTNQELFKRTLKMTDLYTSLNFASSLTTLKLLCSIQKDLGSGNVSRAGKACMCPSLCPHSDPGLGDLSMHAALLRSNFCTVMEQFEVKYQLVSLLQSTGRSNTKYMDKRPNF